MSPCLPSAVFVLRMSKSLWKINGLDLRPAIYHRPHEHSLDGLISPTATNTSRVNEAGKAKEPLHSENAAVHRLPRSSLLHNLISPVELLPNRCPRFIFRSELPRFSRKTMERRTDGRRNHRVSIRISTL